jgi:putative ABC transport system substrate-binding protein
MKTKQILSILLVLLIVLSSACCKEPEPEVYTVGILQISDALTIAEGPFKEGMAALGYVEGENLVYEYRNAQGNMDDLNRFAEELLAETDILVCISTYVAVAVKKASEGKDPPIVFYLVADAVELGLVESYSQPGGNATGVMTGSEDTAGKRLEILLKMDPDIENVLAVYSTNPVMQPEHERLREAAGTLGLTLVEHQISSTEEAAAVFESIQPGEVDAIHIPADTMIADAEDAIIALSVREQIPNIYVGKKNTSLAAYGPDFMTAGPQVAAMVDKILKGTDPASIPVEIPKKFNLIINLGVAEQIGLTLPDEVLEIADVVIEAQ